MMNHLRRAAAAVLLLAGAAAAHAQPSVGVADLTVPDADRALTGVLWYPAQAGGTPALVGDNRVWIGGPANRDAALASGAHPLVVLSHGLGGNLFGQDWLATDLAARGVIVVAVNHPGTTTGDVRPQALATLWQRPDDIARTITSLLADPRLAGHIDASRIAVIGHSLGGYTALALAGVRLERGAMGRYCAGHDDEGCGIAHPVVAGRLPDEQFAASHRDPRVAAVVAMAPALTPAMTPDSLASVTVPVLVIAAAQDTIIPPAHIRAIAGQLPPTAHLAELADAAHNDFLPLCQPGGAALLRATHDEPVCDGAANRAAVHRETIALVAHFLAETGITGAASAP